MARGRPRISFPEGADPALLGLGTHRQLVWWFGVSSHVIARWRAEYGLEDSRFVQEMPPGAAADLARLTLVELATQYGVSKNTTTLWRDRVGLDLETAQRNRWEQLYPGFVLSLQTLKNQKVGEKYGKDLRWVCRMRQRLGIPSSFKVGRPKKEEWW